MMAVAAEGVRGRIYLPASPEQEEIVAAVSIPAHAPNEDLPEKALGSAFKPTGITKHRDLYTPRQLVALTTVSDIVRSILDAAMADGATKDRAEAITTYLSFFVSRLADLNNALCQWRSDPAKEHVGHLFARQAISMVWDFAEANPLGNSAGAGTRLLSSSRSFWIRTSWISRSIQVTLLSWTQPNFQRCDVPSCSRPTLLL